MIRYTEDGSTFMEISKEKFNRINEAAVVHNVRISIKNIANCHMVAIQWNNNSIEYRNFKHKHEMEVFIERFKVSRKWIGPYMPARILFKVNIFIHE